MPCALLLFAGFALANPIPMFGQPSGAPVARSPVVPRMGGAVFVFVADGSAPAAVPRLEPPTGAALPEGPVITLSARSSESWRARTEVASPGRFVPIEQLGQAFEPVPVAVEALPR